MLFMDKTINNWQQLISEEFKMAVNYTYTQKAADGTVTTLTITAVSDLLHTWIHAQGTAFAGAYAASHARKEAMIADHDITVAVHPPVDPEWKGYWDRFLSENNITQVLTDATA